MIYDLKNKYFSINNFNFEENRGFVIYFKERLDIWFVSYFPFALFQIPNLVFDFQYRLILSLQLFVHNIFKCLKLFGSFEILKYFVF